MPVPSLRPDRRLLWLVAVGAVGLAVGVTATVVSGGPGGGDPVASVRRLDLPGGPAEAPADPAAAPPVSVPSGTG